MTVVEQHIARVQSDRPTIPVYEPRLTSEDRDAVIRALESGMISGSGGAGISELERAFERACDVDHAVAVSSGTAALHVAAALCDIRPGCEVAVSACTNIATAIGPVMEGATIVPVDVEADTWCMDPVDLARVIDKDTRAIFTVHAYGHPADMRMIRQVAGSVRIVDDAAEALGAMIDDRPVGCGDGLSDATIFSLYANKPVTSGEGGILVTPHREWAERARGLRNLSFGEPRFLHAEVGWNYRMSNILAALAASQIKRLAQIIAAKRRLADEYSDRLREVPWIQLPTQRPWARSIYWMFCIVLAEDAPIDRDTLANRLRAEGIETRTMFAPMSLQPALRGHIWSRSCPVAESLWRRGLYLPSSPTLTSAELDRICSAVTARGSCR